MPTLDSRPQVVNINHYAGDTLTLHVKAEAEFIAGRVWKAQVRSRRDSQRLDAEFLIYETAEGADVVLASADCQRLAKRGSYRGFWDVQLSETDGSDPVQTVAHGEMNILTDVTRFPA